MILSERKIILQINFFKLVVTKFLFLKSKGTFIQRNLLYKKFNYNFKKKQLNFLYSKFLWMKVPLDFKNKKFVTTNLKKLI